MLFIKKTFCNKKAITDGAAQDPLAARKSENLIWESS